MLILNSNLENMDEKFSLELSNIEKLKDLFTKQKDILLKHFNITIVSLTDNPSYITELNKFLEQFNDIFDNINSSLSKIQILIKKLDSLKKSSDESNDNFKDLLEDYNTYYMENYSSLIDCIIFITNFIDELFVMPDYNKSVESRKKIFASLLESHKENLEKTPISKNLEKDIMQDNSKEISKDNLEADLKKDVSANINANSNISPKDLSTTQEIEKIVSTITKDVAENDTENEFKNTSNTVLDEHKEGKIETSNSKTKENRKSRVTSLPLKDNDTLIISEKDGLVYLPFKVENLKIEYLSKSNKYSGIIDLINNEYIYPISKYKNSVTSRFRESYNLMVNKEKESKLTALQLGLELAFNYSLHPAIITACRNINELDDYLDALENKNLSEFKAFKVEFEYMPKK